MKKMNVLLAVTMLLMAVNSQAAIAAKKVAKPALQTATQAKEGKVSKIELKSELETRTKRIEKIAKSHIESLTSLSARDRHIMNSHIKFAEQMVTALEARGQKFNLSDAQFIEIGTNLSRIKQDIRLSITTAANSKDAAHQEIVASVFKILRNSQQNGEAEAVELTKKLIDLLPTVFTYSGEQKNNALEKFKALSEINDLTVKKLEDAVGTEFFNKLKSCV